jgi:hypothetical protein
MKPLAIVAALFCGLAVLGAAAWFWGRGLP